MNTTAVKYDVFLSFRGEDTRYAFTGNLYKELKSAGLWVFLDDDGIERGEDIKTELDRAIQESRISVVVLSENYPTSGWCLDELVMILDRRREHGLAVLPIFYDVDPSHIRKQTGHVAEAFRVHVGSFNVGKVARWRAALTEVANLAGMPYRIGTDGYQCDFIERLVKVVKEKSDRPMLSLDSHVVGVDYHVQKISKWLNDGSTDVDIFVIHGIGGVGKTTIAKLVYNTNCSRFDCSSFLTSIREIFKKNNGLLHLQRKFISDIFGKPVNEKPQSAEAGWKTIKFYLKRKRLIVILDDVDHKSQLDAILQIKDWLVPGSKIIITTRRLDLMKTGETYKQHRIESLDPEYSLELFSWYAFGEKRPKRGFEDHSRGFVNHCHGLPLALKVMGCSLSGKDEKVWRSHLQKLKEFPNKDILDTLKISYESLQDDNDKNIFLDIACFFVGKDSNFATAILEACGFYAAIGIQNLIDRCLLTIDKENKLTMHHLIQDMGKQIVRENSKKYPEKCSRLWNQRDALDVLSSKSGTQVIEGIIIDINSLNKEKHVSANASPFETDAFERMQKLRILKLNYAHLSGSLKCFSKKLRWLCWHGFPTKSIPYDFPLEGLVALDMRHSKNLKSLWKGTKVLDMMRVLNFSHCPQLVDTPDFSAIRNLEKLFLKGCSNLFEIHASLADLEKLVLLNLKNCKRLSKLPKNLSTMKSLEKLIISGCVSLIDAGEELKKSTLKILIADGIALDQLLSSRTDHGANPWLKFSLPWFSKQKTTREISWTNLPSSLVDLSLVDCNLKDGDFPSEFINLSGLQRLNLSNNPIGSLPQCIANLNSLKKLALRLCQGMRHLELSRLHLEELDVTECHLLEKIEFPEDSSSRRITHGGCENLSYIQNAFKMKRVKDIDREILNSIGFFNLDSMADIEVTISNTIVWYKEKRPLQVFYEHGIFSTYYPGNQIPEWFMNKKMGSTISIQVPSSPKAQIRGLNLCIVYTVFQNETFSPVEIQTTVSNKSNGLITGYQSRYYGVPEPNETMVWLSFWVVGLVFGGGDEIEVSFEVKNDNGEIKECGGHFLLSDQEKNDELRTDTDNSMAPLRFFEGDSHETRLSKIFMELKFIRRVLKFSSDQPSTNRRRFFLC